MEPEYDLVIKDEKTEKELIDYAVDNILGLFEGGHERHLAKLFKIKTEKNERCHRIPFTIYWIVTLKCDYWKGTSNFDKALRGEIEFTPTDEKKVLSFLEELIKHPQIDSIFEKGISYADLRRYVRRYQKRDAIMERKMWRLLIGSFPNWSELLSRYSISTREITDLKNALLQYVGKKRTVAKRDLRRNVRQFRRVNKNLIEWLLDGLEKEGKISFETYCGREYIQIVL